MLRWYLPSWNGDVRFEAASETTTRLTVIEPTLGEIEALGKLHAAFVERGWTEASTFWTANDPNRTEARQQTILDAPFEAVAPWIVAALKGGKQTLSAVVFKDGRIETVEGSAMGPIEELAKAAKKDGKAAASTKRATPSCPRCVPGSIGPASEVLLAFLTPAQHEDWAAHRYIVVTGALTGHRYLIAHRKSRLAARFGRICVDLDDGCVVHFHDHSVPPEEEVLGAKLVLEHRETWLRNEATVFGTDNYFKNPFGDGTDGVPDAVLTSSLGGALALLHPDPAISARILNSSDY